MNSSGFPLAPLAACLRRVGPSRAALACALAAFGLATPAQPLAAQTLPSPPSPPPPGEIPEAEPPRVGPGQPTAPSDRPVPGEAETEPAPAPAPTPTPTPTPQPTPPGYPTAPGPAPTTPGLPGADPLPGPLPATGAVELFRNPSLQDIVEVLEAMQLPVSPIDDNSVIVQLGEFNTLFTLRDNGLKLYAGFSGYDEIELRHINDWNRRKRYSTAYLDASNDPCIEHDLDFEGGVAIPALRSVVNTFSISVSRFAEFLADPASIQRPAGPAPDNGVQPPSPEPGVPSSPPSSPPPPNPGAGFPPSPSPGAGSLDVNPAPGL